MLNEEKIKLENIGFYTLSDHRCKTASDKSPLQRCELVLTSRCNFKCPYCRGVGGPDLSFEKAVETIKLWKGLKNIRFSGGEPTLYSKLPELCNFAKCKGIERIALSTNGSASLDYYKLLIDCGVNDFSISLDACCAEDGDKLAGRKIFNTITDNIREISKLAYTTVGVVLVDENKHKINQIIEFADSLGVSDIRVIPAAREGNTLKNIYVSKKLLNKYPILKYRIQNLQQGKQVRGLTEKDCNKCAIVLDDMAVNQGQHFPCIIYMRESGKAIGKVSDKMREERLQWYLKTDTKKDPICKENCLDVCIDYNNLHQKFKEENTRSIMEERNAIV